MGKLGYASGSQMPECWGTGVHAQGVVVSGCRRARVLGCCGTGIHAQRARELGYWGTRVSGNWGVHLGYWGIRVPGYQVAVELGYWGVGEPLLWCQSAMELGAWVPWFWGVRELG